MLPTRSAFAGVAATASLPARCRSPGDAWQHVTPLCMQETLWTAGRGAWRCWCCWRR